MRASLFYWEGLKHINLRIIIFGIFPQKMATLGQKLKYDLKWHMVILRLSWVDYNPTYGCLMPVADLLWSMFSFISV